MSTESKARHLGTHAQARHFMTVIMVVVLCFSILATNVVALHHELVLEGNTPLDKGCIKIDDSPLEGLKDGETITFTINSDNIETNPSTGFMPADFWIKITRHDTEMGTTFDFTSNYPIDKVLVKGGTKYTQYTYADVKSGTGLHAPINASGKYAGVSHIVFCFGEIPVEAMPAIDVEKLVSVDGGMHWLDADSAPGPEAMVGAEVWFKFIVKNTGNVTLTGITLTDDYFTIPVDKVHKILAAGEWFEIVIKAEAHEGQHVDIATVKGMYGEHTYTDTDKAHYYGKKPVEAMPAIDVEKSVANKTEGGAYGELVVLEEGQTAIYKVVVKNTGDVDLHDVILTDDMVAVGTVATIEGDGTKTFAMGAWAEPYITIGHLEAGQSVTVTYMYLTKKADVGEPIMNEAMAEGMYNGKPVSDKDTAAISVEAIPLAGVPGIKLEKWVQNVTAGTVKGETALGFVGDQFRYTIWIKNTGDVDLANVVLHDSRALIGTQVTINGMADAMLWANDGAGYAMLDIGTLKAGAELMITYIYTAKAADEDKTLTNLAHVVGEYRQIPVEASDTAKVIVHQTPIQTGESDSGTLAGVSLLAAAVAAFFLRRRLGLQF